MVCRIINFYKNSNEGSNRTRLMIISRIAARERFCCSEELFPAPLRLLVTRPGPVFRFATQKCKKFPYELRIYVASFGPAKSPVNKPLNYLSSLSDTRTICVHKMRSTSRYFIGASTGGSYTLSSDSFLVSCRTVEDSR